MALNIRSHVHVLKQAKLAIDSYFYKTAYNPYRYKSRMNNDKITFVPSIFGDEDVHIVGRDVENPLIRSEIGVLQHPEAPAFPDEYSLDGPPKGKIYSKYPFKFTVEEGKSYAWCACGYSNSQPFCDMTHRILWPKHLVKRTPKFRSIKYTATETKEVWFCNCKQSSERPICDGTCKTEEITSKRK